MLKGGRSSSGAPNGRLLPIAELLAVAYIAAIAEIASASGAFYILFPELGALSYDSLSRPHGRWGSAPLHLATSPILTAMLGTIVTRNLSYGILSVLIVVTGSAAIILALRSPVSPAISAGFLPLVLGVPSWWYPPAIALGTVLLSLISIGWRRWCIGRYDSSAFRQEDADALEPDCRRYLRFGALLVFVALAVGCVTLTRLRFLLFPPLVVIGFEMFREPESCPWAEAPVRLPLVCLLTAAIGLFFWNLFGAGMAAAACSMAVGIAVLRILKLHVPPALAVALLPLVMDSPTLSYPLAVVLGTSLLAMWFLAYKRLIEPFLFRIMERPAV